MGDTKIQWTDKTWNPVRGCTRVSEGCRNCYAEGVAARFSARGMAYEGIARRSDHGPRWTGKLAMVPEHLEDPVRWKKPRRIFVNSMSDLFHERLTEDEITSVFNVMLAAPRHTYQVLTKRAERMCRFVDSFCEMKGWDLLPRFIQLGVSAEDQENFDARAPWLGRTRAAVTFVSAEPLLGGIDLAPFRFDWVIVGGESGLAARPFDVDWARSLVAQVRAYGGAPFVKQLGARPFDSAGRWRPLTKFPTHGPDIAEWGPDFAVREFPG